MMKSQKTKDHYQLYSFKSLLSKRKIEDEEKEIQRFFAYWRILKGSSTYYERIQIEPNYNKEQLYKSIGECIEAFEGKIIPSIFSIELFWRELVYFTSMMKESQIRALDDTSVRTEKQESTVFFDFLVRLRRENILNASPFEIIDGDLLYMPQEFYKTVFKGLTDRVIVVSVLGPQSSGKSTLLNFFVWM